MIQVKIVVRMKFRLNEEQKENIKKFIETELDKNLITDFYIEEHVGVDL